MQAPGKPIVDDVRTAYTQAVEVFREVLKIDEHNSTARHGLGFCFGILGEPEEVIIALAPLVKDQPTDQSAKINLAVAFSQTGHWEGAVQQYHDALDNLQWDMGLPVILETAMQVGKIHHDMAHAQRMTGSIDDALMHYQEAVRQQPQNADFHCSLATVYWECQDMDNAANEYAAALKLDPAHSKALKGSESFKLDQEAAKANGLPSVSKENMGGAFCCPC